MLRKYFKSLYQDTTRRAYDSAYSHIAASIAPNSVVLDCGASNGYVFDLISKRSGLSIDQYNGIEWSSDLANEAQHRGLNVINGDLNRNIPFNDNSFTCIFALSVLEHLLNPCKFLRECHRLLKPGGQLVILTPNISTYFTAALIIAGRMPSSGPHPDSDQLLKSEEVFKVSSELLKPDTEGDTPVHRHLVVFSYRTLHKYLQMVGFLNIYGEGYGLYPFPKFSQPILEKVDPYHCHQMVFIVTKSMQDLDASECRPKIDHL